MELTTEDRVRADGLHALFEASVRRAPDDVALVDGPLSLTYAELDARAEGTARRLRALGVGPGAVVGLAARRRADAVAALLGALKAGAAYCPLDPSHPLERLRFMLDDSSAAALAAGREDAEKLADPARPTVLLERPEEAEPARPAAPPRAAGLRDLAYVIYTSGSTGAPKGVAVEHAAAADLARVAAEHRGLGPADRVLQFGSLCFDASVVELFPAWHAGATVVLRGEKVLSPVDLLRFLDDNGITVMDVPTAYWHELSADLAPRGATLPASLRLVVTGGEALRAESLALWRPSAGRTRFLNCYGPTEIVVECAVYDVPADAADSGPVPIGWAYDGAELHVLDEVGRPAPAGADGELYVGGRRLARGYLNRPELTAERFVPDPFSGRPGARLYRTGDRVRRRPDGALEFVGRLDGQIKLRGFRIEPGEVESALASHPAVGTCAVVLREESSGLRRLVAYVSPRGGATASAPELRAFLLAKLPEYMVPAAVVALPALPLTPNGKVDRRALPPPATAPPAARSEALKAASPLHRQILDIWEEVLGVSPIGLSDDFHALGGHSLLAVKIMAGVERRLGRRPPLAALARGATIERMAAIMGEALRAEDGQLVRFGPEEGADPLFFVHPGLGGFYCQEFSRAMPQRPVYLLTGLDLSRFQGVPTIEEIARLHVKAIRAAHPRGPYRLGGYSLGSTIAYEMARQLAAEGERVPALVLVAASMDDAPRCWTAARLASGAVGRLLGHDQAAVLARFARWGNLGRLAGGLLRRGGAARLSEALGRSLTLAKTRGAIGGAAADAAEFDGTLQALLWAWAAYRPGVYQGPVILIEVEERFRSRRASEFRRLAPATERVRLPYDHDAVVTSHAAELGAELARILARERPAANK